MKKNVSIKSLLEEVVNETVARAVKEEFIGNVGGVNLYQMGGSIKRPELYNLDSEGKPTRDPGVAGIKRKKKSKKRKSVKESHISVLSLLKEILAQEINSRSLNENTGAQTPAAKRGAIPSFGGVSAPVETYKSSGELVEKLKELSQDEAGVDAAFDDPSSKYRSALKGIVKYAINANFNDILELYTKYFANQQPLMNLFTEIVSKIATTSELEKIGTKLETAENRMNLDVQMSKKAPIEKEKIRSKSQETKFDIMPEFTQKVNSLIPHIRALLDDALKGTDTSLSSLAASLLNTSKQAESQDLGKDDLVSLVLDKLASLIPTASSARDKSEQTALEKKIVNMSRAFLTKESRTQYQLFGLSESDKRAIACAFLVCILSG